MQTPFLAYFDGWRGGEVLLLIVDNEGVEWLRSRFEHLGADDLDESNGRNLFLATPILSNQTVVVWSESS
jgi:hypothetical protein